MGGETILVGGIALLIGILVHIRDESRERFWKELVKDLTDKLTAKDSASAQNLAMLKSLDGMPESPEIEQEDSQIIDADQMTEEDVQELIKKHGERIE